MANEETASLTVTIIQWSATMLVAFLVVVLLRSVRRPFLHFWAGSWGCLSVALLALTIAFQTAEHARWFYAAYFFFEYAWGFLLLAGCLNFARGVQFDRHHLVAGPIGVIVALVLSQLDAPFNLIFAFHAIIVAGFVGLSALALLWPRNRKEHGPGLWLMGLALGLLALVFAHYVPLCAYAGFTGDAHAFPHLAYSAVYDMLLELLLAFGMVVVAMDSVRRDLEKANFDLAAASLRLQVLAQEDSLTDAYNRHAFYTFTDKGSPGRRGFLAGCVAVIDLNDLKRINDTLGHHAGDGAIRAAAQAIRSVIRADDLLFRWGGDEFLILWPNVCEHDARDRLAKLNPLLEETMLPGYSLPVRVSMSYGVAAVEKFASLEQAIHEADGEMYTSKQSAKLHSRHDTPTERPTRLTMAS